MTIHVGWWADATPLCLGRGHRFGAGHAAQNDLTVDIDHQLRHIHCVGSSGSGKSRLIRHLVCQHIQANRGFTLVDPHGDLHQEVLGHIADLALPDKFTERDVARLGDKLIILEPGHQTYGVPGINLLTAAPGQQPYAVVDGILQVLRDLWHDSWGARMEDVCRASLLLLQELGLTVVEMLPLLSDEQVRDRLVARSQNPDLRQYFERHLGGIRLNEVKQWLESSRNKWSAFVSSPYLKPILGQTRSTLNFPDILNQGKWLLINCSRDKLKESRRLLGALLIWLLQNAAVSREAIPVEERVAHFLLVDEFSEFYSAAVEHILTGSRKYRVGLALFHQTTTQAPFDERPAIIDTVLGNCHTFIVFTVSRKDATRLAGEIFFPSGAEIKFQESLLGIPLEEPRLWGMSEEREHQAAQLMQQGVGEAFIAFRGRPEEHPAPYAATVPHVPDVRPNRRKVEALRRHVAERYYQPVAQVEREIRERWARLAPEAPRVQGHYDYTQ